MNCAPTRLKRSALVVYRAGIDYPPSFETGVFSQTLSPAAPFDPAAYAPAASASRRSASSWAGL